MALDLLDQPAMLRTSFCSHPPFLRRPQPKDGNLRRAQSYLLVRQHLHRWSYCHTFARPELWRHYLPLGFAKDGLPDCVRLSDVCLLRLQRKATCAVPIDALGIAPGTIQRHEPARGFRPWFCELVRAPEEEFLLTRTGIHRW